MNKEKKREFQLRISQANKTGLIVILYEIAIEYIDEAIEAYNLGDKAAYILNMEKTRDCIEEMMCNLHFEYELAKTLKGIYLYMKKIIREDIISGNPDGMDIVRKELLSLRESYNSISDTDTSAPVMVNTQAVLTGMTYGRNRILDELTQDCTSRGFRV